MLTVVMPVYNVARYVASAIQSVLAQTHADFRLLIVDDGSTDDTLRIARDFEARDPRIRVHTHANRGVANTMNTALSMCDTEWVACMHGDDLMLPQRLERQMRFVRENPDVAVVSSLVDWIDEKSRVVGRSRSHLTSREAVARARCGDGSVAFPHPAVMFRRQVIIDVGGYRQDFFPAEDTELWNRVADAGHLVLVQPEVLLQYRLHASSASMSKSTVMMQKLEWMQRCIAARRGGNPEPTWEQYLESRRQGGILSRLNELRRETGNVMYQAAIGDFASRRYLRLTRRLLAAGVLRPGLVLSRLLPRLIGAAS
jgi:glycosyltransferase involved in cell wall biosynthesis